MKTKEFCLSKQAQLLKQGIYEHHKGKRYKLITVARHTETLEEYVVYQALYDAQEFWIRPVTIFCETIVKESQSIPRFRYVEEA